MDEGYHVLRLEVLDDPLCLRRIGVVLGYDVLLQFFLQSLDFVFYELDFAEIIDPFVPKVILEQEVGGNETGEGHSVRSV